MAGASMEWEGQLGRRLRVRDLYILSTVAKSGSMAKAARQLRISQPAVSEAIANLEHIVGVPLLDRSPRGIEPTIYGEAMLKRANAVFDELKQSIKDIEYLADPTAGELRIGCPESIASSILPGIIERFSERHPAVVLDLEAGTGLTVELVSKLADRRLDLLLARTVGTQSVERFDDTLNVEVLFYDEIVVVAGMKSPWARHREIDLAELTNARWILSARDTWNYSVIEDAYRARGLDMPNISVTTVSVHVRTNLLGAGNYVTAMPKSVMRLYGDRFSLKVLPIDLPIRQWPVAIVTLKKRTLSPIVERFIACAREIAKSLPRSERMIR